MKYLIVISINLIVSSNSENYNSLQIKDFKLTKCKDVNYPVIVNDVTIHFAKTPRIQVSGALSSEVDLVPPIWADVQLERSIWGVWIPVPCENNKGSCTYHDLCDYGIPKNQTCPDLFLKNDVPCRCPIPKGNYTIKPEVDLELSNASSILSGTYRGAVQISQNGLLLSCYNVYFVLYDTSELYSVILV